MAGVIQDQITLAAGAVEENAFAGSVFEFARRNSIMSLGVQTDVAGGLITIQTGSTVILEESPCAVGTGYPRVPDEFYYNAGALAGERLLLRLRNDAGGPVVFSFVAQLADA